MIILNVTENQGFNDLEDAFLEEPQGAGNQFDTQQPF